MHETAHDLERLQALLDASHAAAGSHMRSVFDEEHRVDASRLVEMLPGVQVLNLATVTSHGEPRVAPVDGLFYRGRWHFGSSPDSVRFRHIRTNPAVSGSHVRGEEFAVVVHGRAVEIDPSAPDHAGFKAYLLETYGDDWYQWAAVAPYAVIEANRRYTRWFPLSGEASV
jgi:uncharacterized pyridoxamine 5'-phosphate oxidase family protein